MRDDRLFVRTPTGYVTMAAPRLRDNPCAWVMLVLNIALVLVIAWALGNLR